MKLVTKSCLALMFLPLLNFGQKSIAYEGCKIQNTQSLYGLITNKIDRSEISTLLPINCSEVEKINSYDEKTVLITSGRKRGKYIVCLSNTTDNPCKHKLAVLNGSGNPAEMLSQVFGIYRTESKVLNETVERLFFKPSEIID